MTSFPVVGKLSGNGSSFNSCHLVLHVQNRADAHKALSKNGTPVNGVLLVGVKSVDPIQRQALNGRANNQGFMPLPPPLYGLNSEQSLSNNCSGPYYLQNGSTTSVNKSGAIASPEKSLVSKVMDLMFGV